MRWKDGAMLGISHGSQHSRMARSASSFIGLHRCFLGLCDASSVAAFFFPVEYLFMNHTALNITHLHRFMIDSYYG